MSIWTRISDALKAVAQGESLSEVFARLRTPPEQRVGFTIAVIALGAKMAKADGRVTRDEVSVFRRIFTIPPGEEGNAARVFDMARTDIAGFDLYAARIKAMYGEGAHEPLQNLLEGLFHIALADGEFHPKEAAFLEEVARIFGISAPCFRQIRARLVPDAARDPYEVLGVPLEASLDDIKARWREEVRRSHPDNLHARGLPSEAISMAEKHLAAVNAAWEQIQKDRSGGQNRSL